MENKFTDEHLKNLYIYLNENTKRPNKYLLEIIGYVNAGGKDAISYFVDKANLTKNEKDRVKKKALQLENIYQEFLKTKA
jgi:hypothetical protein